jgi:hypothetical protein
MSPCYEILRYGHDKTKNQVTDAHTAGKLAKFIIGEQDLINRLAPPQRGFHEAPFFDPLKGNPFKFEFRQFEAADIVIYVDKDRKDHVLKGQDL